MKIVCGTQEMTQIEELQNKTKYTAPPVVIDNPIQLAVDHAVAWSYSWSQMDHYRNEITGDENGSGNAPPSSGKLSKLIRVIRDDESLSAESHHLFRKTQPHDLLKDLSTARQ